MEMIETLENKIEKSKKRLKIIDTIFSAIISGLITVIVVICAMPK